MNISLIDFIFLILLTFGCRSNENSRIETTTEKSGLEKAAPVQDSSINKMDSLTLDSILYAGKFRLQEYTNGPFSYEPRFIDKKEIVRISSKSHIKSHQLEYEIVVKLKDSNLTINNFNPIDEESYDYLSSKIKINNSEIDITNLHFLNEPASKVFPVGLWHGSIEGSALKYYRYNNKDYYLLNGVNLYCNGTNCNSFQVYLLVRSKNNIKANPIFFQGFFPYHFENIHLIDIEKDGYPEIYVTKNEIDEIRRANDFDIYTVDASGTLRKK